MKGKSLAYIFGLIVLQVASAFGQQNHMSPVSSGNPEPSKLEFGTTVERAISGGERHLYRVELGPNQFIKVEASQQNCDIILAMDNPEKNGIFEFKDDSFRNGPEVQTAAVPAAGTYILKVISFEPTTQTGTYTLKISEPRPASDKELSETAAFAINNKISKIEKGALTTEQTRQIITEMETSIEKFRFAGNRKWEGVILSNLGYAYTRLGNWAKASELQRQAIDIHRSIGSDENTLLMLTSLGDTYRQGNEPQKALEVLSEAARLASIRNDALNESTAFRFIGQVYEDSGDIARALFYYSRSLERAQGVAKDRAIAIILNHLGHANLILGENLKAVDFFQRSIEIGRQTKNKQIEAEARGSLARAFAALGDSTKVETHFAEALAINRSLADKIGEAGILRSMAEVRLKSGNPDEAIDLLNRSREIYLAVEGTRSLAETHLLLGKAWAQKGEFELAQNNAVTAVNLIEKMRTGLKTTDLRDSFSFKLRDFYAFYVEVLMERHKLEPGKNYAELAFQASESARARGFLNLLAESKADIRQGVDEKLLQREVEIRNLLSAQLENLTKRLNGNTKNEVVQELKNEIERIRTEHERAQEQIRSASPRYAALTQPKTLSLQEIQTSVLHPDAVLLEYFLGRTKSFVWVVTKTGFHSVELPAGEAIESASRRFYESLTARNKDIKFETPPEREARIARADTDLEKYSRELGDMIIAPVAPLVANKRLLVAADGALQYIPFGALTMGDSSTSTARTRFLVESNEIVSLPSASALAVLRKETAGRPTVSRTLAVLADPIFDKKDERFQTPAARKRLDLRDGDKVDLIASAKKQTRAVGDLGLRDGLDLARLPFTRREAEMITSVIAEGQKEKWLDFDANRRLAISPQLANYRYVHFATHGFINDKNPELSGLVFSTVNENGKEQDGFLRVGDVYGLNLPAEMVVLSGCRTGVGKEIGGEGIVGMTRAFMYAGAKRVTVSLWDINDEATSELMSHYYREMFGAKKRTPAAALRQAQNAMIKDKRWSSPYFWATFVLQGEPN